eukprot:13467.XXX_1022044_1022160_1 [CDS] Oithona nana genome sequencing.
MNCFLRSFFSFLFLSFSSLSFFRPKLNMMKAITKISAK